MQAYYRFLRTHSGPVSFGWLLTFFASFGQTFFISLFVPALLAEFHFTKTTFGAYFAIATVLSALLLLRYGHLVDTLPVRVFTRRAIWLLLGACLLLAAAPHPVLVFAALVGMRLGGQGLMSHISLSVMSRHFQADRGKALSLTSLGFPMAEMAIPFLLALLLPQVPWRMALVLSASSLVGLLLALPRFRLETFDAGPLPDAAISVTKGQYLRQLVQERPFWMIMVSSFSFSAIVTGFFFYQYLIADAKGWPRPWYALCFAGYAAVRALFMLFGGPLADRYSARRLFPLYLLPLMLGLLCLEWVPGATAPLLFLLLAGVTAGLSSVLGGAVIAEVYGTARVGQVRSLFSMGMVLSTALTPLVFGALLDAGVSVGALALGSVAVLAGAALNSLRLASLPAATGPIVVPAVAKSRRASIAS